MEVVWELLLIWIVVNTLLVMYLCAWSDRLHMLVYKML
jgi:hypothetical protein